MDIDNNYLLPNSKALNSVAKNMLKFENECVYLHTFIFGIQMCCDFNFGY